MGHVGQGQPTPPGALSHVLCPRVMGCVVGKRSPLCCCPRVLQPGARWEALLSVLSCLPGSQASQERRPGRGGPPGQAQRVRKSPEPAQLLGPEPHPWADSARMNLEHQGTPSERQHNLEISATGLPLGNAGTWPWARYLRRQLLGSRLRGALTEGVPGAVAWLRPPNPISRALFSTGCPGWRLSRHDRL